MLGHIAWFNEAPVEVTSDGSLTSPDASVRKRCLIPARAIEALGVECAVFGNLNDADPAKVCEHLQKLDADIVVAGKMSSASLVQLAKAAKHLGCYIVADLSAEDAGTPELAPHRQDLVDLADQAVAATPEVAARIMTETDTPTIVIPDVEESDDTDEREAVVKLWLECFRQLKLKPPPSANSNTPVTSQV